MGEIYQKAQQEHMKAFYQNILDKLEGLSDDTPDWREELVNTLDELTQDIRQSIAELEPEAGNEPWDFSREKARAEFARGDGIVIRPIRPEDEEVYHRIRMQYSLLYRTMICTAEEEKKKARIFSREALSPQVFYCIICDAEDLRPMGYLGIKDTRAGVWELAIELDEKDTRRGIGPRSLRLYLNELQRITGRREFRAEVEVDNLPSQKCFEGLGAELAGLCGSAVLRTGEERRRFEEENLDLIDAHMRELADRLGVEPRALLSHVLAYRLTCPLQEPQGTDAGI